MSPELRAKFDKAFGPKGKSSAEDVGKIALVAIMIAASSWKRGKIDTETFADILSKSLKCAQMGTALDMVQGVAAAPHRAAEMIEFLTNMIEKNLDQVINMLDLCKAKQ